MTMYAYVRKNFIVGRIHSAELPAASKFFAVLGNISADMMALLKFV